MLTIIGDNKCSSPYSGADPINVQLTGAQPGKWYELIVPTNFVFTSQNGLEPTFQSWGWQQAPASGTLTFVFNASTSDPVVETTQANGWVLPSGIYQLRTREFSDGTGASIESVDFEITAEATQAVQIAVSNKAKARGKK